MIRTTALLVKPKDQVQTDRGGVATVGLIRQWIAGDGSRVVELGGCIHCDSDNPKEWSAMFGSRDEILVIRGPLWSTGNGAEF